jgi:hypothetical protein
MQTIKGGVMGLPDMANRTRMPPRQPIPPGPGGDQREALARLMFMEPQPEWQPGPTNPWSGLDTSNWKNNPLLGAPMQYQGNVPQGPTAEDLQYLKLFGDQMWKNPSYGALVGNRSGRP